MLLFIGVLELGLMIGLDADDVNADAPNVDVVLWINTYIFCKKLKRI
jgi:hypothetical protein